MVPFTEMGRLREDGRISGGEAPWVLFLHLNLDVPVGQPGGEAEQACNSGERPCWRQT